MRSMTRAGAVLVPRPMLSGWAACRKNRGEMTNGDRGGDAVCVCVCQLTFVSLRTEEERN